MKALVTGASGFIGRYLVARLLCDGYGVRALVRDSSRTIDWPSSVELAFGDVRSVDATRDAPAGCDTVVHVAGKAHDMEELNDTDEHEEVIIQGTKNLLTAAKEARVRKFIFLSSLSVYGSNSQSQRDESYPCSPISAYGRAKLTAETCVFEQGKKSGIDTSCLRPASVYGPGCKGSFLRMISAIDSGLFPPIPEVRNRRSMVHVANLVQAVMLAATHPAANGQCYNVTDARPYSTRELYELICRGLGRPIPTWQTPVWALKAIARVGDVIGRVRGRRFIIDSDALEKLIGSAWFSSEKISRELGYRPTMSFEEALPELIAWYRASQA